MGMDLTSNWKCDRCTSTKLLQLGDTPEDWKFIIEPVEIALDPKSYTPDMKINIQRRLICDECVDTFVHDFMMRPRITEDDKAPKPSDVKLSNESWDPDDDPSSTDSLGLTPETLEELERGIK